MPLPTSHGSIPRFTKCVTAAAALEAMERGDQELLMLDRREDGGDGKIDGFLPLYSYEDQGRLWMEIPNLDREMIHYAGFGAGLGSDDLGLDRGALTWVSDRKVREGRP